jgi:predicted ATPase with chaperone activity
MLAARLPGILPPLEPAEMLAARDPAPVSGLGDLRGTLSLSSMFWF